MVVIFLCILIYGVRSLSQDHLSQQISKQKPLCIITINWKLIKVNLTFLTKKKKKKMIKFYIKWLKRSYDPNQQSKKRVFTRSFRRTLIVTSLGSHWKTDKQRERERENETGKRSFLFLKAPGDQYLAESTFGPPKVAGLNSEAIRFAISSLVPSRFPPTVPGPEKEWKRGGKNGNDDED